MALATNIHRKGTPILPGLIGFILAFRTCMTVLWFQQDPQQGTIVSAVFTVALIPCVILCATGATPSVPSLCFRTPTIRWLTALLGLAFISLFWSAAPFFAAFGYWTEWAADVAAVWLVLRYGDAEVQAEAIMKGFIWGSCIVAFVAWALPTAEDHRLGDLDFLHPNAIGFLFAIATFLAMYLARKNRLWNWAAFFLAATLLRTISKTSIIAFAIAFCFWLLMDASLTRAARIKIGIASALVVASLWGILESYLADYTSGAGPETLTGRTIVWAMSVEYAIKTPWIGNGFYAYRFVVPSFNEFQAWQAHNELLQQFFSYGIPGVIVVVTLYWTFFRQIRRADSSGIKILASTLLIFALVRGLTDTEVFDLSYPLWLMTMLSILLAASSDNSAQPGKADLPEVYEEA